MSVLKRVPIVLSVSGMSCASCVSHIEKVLKKQDGVIDVSVNLATETATIFIRRNQITSEILIQAVREAGYDARLNDPSRSLDREGVDKSAELNRQFRSFLISALLSTPLMLPMIFHLLGIDWQLSPLFQWVLATPVQFFLGARFYRASFLALKVRSANMDLLIALGTSAAYFLSILLMVFPELQSHQGSSHLYFESSAVVITLVLLGKWLEARARHQASEAIRSLRAIRPDRARIIREGKELEVSLSEVISGDIVLVRPGERIPIDGSVIEGRSQVDESLITGESLPLTKEIGQAVIGGSMNLDGFLRIQTTAVGGETVLSKVVRLIENAQAEKAPIQRLVDRVSAFFVPLVLGISFLTFCLTWYFTGNPVQALLHAVAVLVIACPCALGLATPTSILVGTGLAAKQGILIQNSDALELARALNVVVFDKTGTLTEGKPKLTSIYSIGQDENVLIQMAASIQMGSEHPLAKAVLSETQHRSLSFEAAQDIRVFAGRGIEGVLGEKVISIGSKLFMKDQGVDLSSLSEKNFHGSTQTISYVAQVKPEKLLIGVLGFSDKIKTHAKATIQALHQRKIRTLLLTGDFYTSASKVAEDLSITEFRSEVLPEDKVRIIKELKKDGSIVAMVGDGINDTPALAEADVGMAMATGTDVAMQVSGITLMRGEPLLVVDTIEISKRIYTKIRQNLFLAFIYNVLGIPLAAFGYLSPWIAGGAMALSSVSVVANALLLKRWNPLRILNKTHK